MLDLYVHHQVPAGFPGSCMVMTGNILLFTTLEIWGACTPSGCFAVGCLFILFIFKTGSHSGDQAELETCWVDQAGF